MHEIAFGTGRIWAGGTRKVKHQIHFGVDRLANVPIPKLEPRAAHHRFDVSPRAGEQIVHTNDVEAFGEQAFTQMRPYEPSSACHQRLQSSTPLSAPTRPPILPKVTSETFWSSPNNTHQTRARSTRK